MYYLNPRIWHRYITGHHFRPNLHIRDISEIPVPLLKQKQIKGLIFDVDNTLTEHHQRALFHKAGPALEKLQKEFKCVIFSNCGPVRHKELLEIFSLPVVEYGYKKPNKDGFIRAAHILQLDLHQVAMVGDRLLTDIIGANQLGIFSILVDPFSGHEPGRIRLFRSIERNRLRRLNKKRPS